MALLDLRVLGRGVCQAAESLGIAVQLALGCACAVVNVRVIQGIRSLTCEGKG